MTNLDLIGNTPVRDVSKLSPNPAVRLLVKLEVSNPFGSLKDRVAKRMIQEALDQTWLNYGQRIVAPSSGNTGISLAGIGCLKGHGITVVMSGGASRERVQALEFLGADVVLTSPAEGTDGAIKKARQLARENPGWCLLDQYSSDANPSAHFETTGPEIWREAPEITHFVSGIGSGGTIVGVGRFLKEHNPGVAIVVAEPESGVPIEGVRNLADGHVPLVFRNWNGPNIVDIHCIIEHSASQRMASMLARECGIFAGPSTGLALAASLEVARSIDRGTILFLACDGFWKYLSQSAWREFKYVPDGGPIEFDLSS
jgi:cysteine synthase